MASCYDRVSCSVSEDGNVLTINTKNGTCVFTRGDDVSFTETAVSYIITINGEPHSIPKIEPGDDVSFTEDDDCYIITINNEPHCIPKCRYYRDCEGNILDECERIVTCDDLESRGFISCFDEDDFDITNNEVDGELVRCLHIAWDQICAEAETVGTVPDNAQMLFCAGGNVRKTDFSDAVNEVLENCITADIPHLGDTCGDPRSLVLVEGEDGCKTFASYSSSDGVRARGNFREAHPEFAPDQTGLVLPDDFTDPTNYYTRVDYQNDWQAGTLDETTLSNSMLAKATFTLDCPQRLNIEFVYDNINPADVQTAYDEKLQIGWRRRVDGGPWEYPEIAGVVTVSTSRNAVESNRQRIDFRDRTFQAGENEIQFFYFAEQTGNVHIRANTNDYSQTTSTPLPAVNLRPVL